MPSRVLSLYTTDEIVTRARYLRDQVDAGATSVNNGLGANATYIGVAAAKRLIEELMDELDLRAGKHPPKRWNYTNVHAASGYGHPWPGRNRFWGI